MGDLTYLRTGEGWLYLATVIDLFNREVVGRSMADHMRTELVSDALTMAHIHGRIEPGALFHSDHGSPSTPPTSTRSSLRTSTCARPWIARALAGPTRWPSRGSRLLKHEIYLPAELRHPTTREIRLMQQEVFYNRRRLHSALGCRAPPRPGLTITPRPQPRPETHKDIVHEACHSPEPVWQRLAGLSGNRSGS